MLFVCDPLSLIGVLWKSKDGIFTGERAAYYWWLNIEENDCFAPHPSPIHQPCRVQITTVAVSSWGWWPCHVQKIISYHFHHLLLLNSFCPHTLLWCSLSLRGCDIGVLFGVEHSAVTESQHSDQLGNWTNCCLLHTEASLMKAESSSNSLL